MRDSILTDSILTHDDIASAASNPDVRMVAAWADEYGCTYVQATTLVDNRRSRVLARIDRMGIAVERDTLEIVRIR
jgi:hypothetical protein